MALRLRLFDVRMSRLPGEIGLCASDVKGIATAVNAIQQRILFAKEAGEEGWFGTWAEMAFSVSRSTPYLTVPRQVARIEAVNVCNRPAPVNNQFAEYLQFGNGRLPKTCGQRGLPVTAAYMRNMVPAFVDPPTAPFIIQAFPTDPADVESAARVLVQGIDPSGNIVYSTQPNGQVAGEYLTLSAPFSSSVNHYATLTGIQKDITVGAVRILAVDVTTGVSTTILTLEPGEQTASYRRYYFNGLPQCCPGASPGAPLAVTAMCKLDLIPVVVDQDYLLIQNLEALIAEAGSYRYSSMDTGSAKEMGRERHQAAIGLLNGELAHWLGKEAPAVTFKPFGSASFNRITRGVI